MTRKQLQVFDDHYDMLADGVRMRSYAEAIRRTIRPGDRVVDLGAGLGVLGFMALKAGAARVYAIEKTASIDLARKVAAANGLSDRVTFFHGNSKDFSLDEPADVLLSETLGSFGLEENTLDFTLDARQRLLREDGRMLPRAIRVFVAPVSHDPGRVAFWKDVQGLDFSPAVEELAGRMATADITVEDVLAGAQVYAQLDLRSHSETTVTNTLRFPIQRAGSLQGVAGWFHVSLCEGVVLKTGPDSPKTHWRQAFFPLREPTDVVPGDVFEATLTLGPKGDRSDDTVVRLDHRCTQVPR